MPPAPASRPARGRPGRPAAPSPARRSARLPGPSASPIPAPGPIRRNRGVGPRSGSGSPARNPPPALAGRPAPAGTALLRRRAGPPRTPPAGPWPARSHGRPARPAPVAAVRPSRTGPPEIAAHGRREANAEKHRQPARPAEPRSQDPKRILHISLQAGRFPTAAPAAGGCTRLWWSPAEVARSLRRPSADGPWNFADFLLAIHKVRCY